jgi:8-oxo-dGTP diphosphatase
VIRTYPSSPVLAVSAVVLHAACVLLVRRAHAPLAGAWALPGGVVELGEPLAAAVIRELQEETGLKVEPVKLLDAIDKIDRDADGAVRHHYVLAVFHCRMIEGTLHAASDAEEARWVPVRELLEENDYFLSPESVRLIKLALSQEPGPRQPIV